MLWRQDPKMHDDMDSRASSEDEISVGCPSPPASPNNNDDYFKPLKKLKMVPLEREREREEPPRRSVSPDERRKIPAAHSNSNITDGVKSFSILDILSHRPMREPQPQKIVRPWDLHTTESVHALQRLHHHLRLEQQLQLQHQLELGEAWRTRELQLELGEPWRARAELQLELQQLRAQRLLARGADSETASSRSSSGSECCSPGGARPVARPRQQPLGTPLDALFQMTSKTFEANSSEASADGQANHLNLFNSRPQPKKKRKSRTAFTNHQIFELEKRFLYQKYLSPADRDEIAASLGLSNAQVITWFQNRRAKLKRDMEELKKDVESAKALSAHKTFLENVTDLSILKKKAVSLGASEEAATNLIVSAQK